MYRHRKAIIISIAALLALFIGIKVVKAIYPAFAKAQLQRKVGKMEPWTASTSYSDAGWKQLIKTAKAFQTADPKIADAALNDYVAKAASDPNQLAIEQGKVFLLLRVMFDVPETDGQRVPSALWERRNSDVNPDGTINQAWPLVWNGGKPRLVAGRQGSAGSAYSVRNEYSFMRFRYKYRDLSKAG
jgi:hypothetical protein